MRDGSAVWTVGADVVLCAPPDDATGAANFVGGGGGHGVLESSRSCARAARASWAAGGPTVLSLLYAGIGLV